MDFPKCGYIENWQIIPFILRKERGELADFLGSNICHRLCSPRLKDVIDQNVTPNDIPIQWLPVSITKEKTGESFDYFYLHFPEVCNCLDEEETIYEDFLGKPRVQVAHYSLAKIQDKSIFNCPSFEKLTTVVSKNLRKAIMDAGCTGLKFEQTIVLEEYTEDNQLSNKIVNL